MKTYWIIDREPIEVDLVGKFVPENDYYDSKFHFVYQVKRTGDRWAAVMNKKREEIYLKKKDAELAIDAAIKLKQIEQAEQVIRQYKNAVEIVKKAKKEGLTDIDFVMELTNEKKK